MGFLVNWLPMIALSTMTSKINLALISSMTKTSTKSKCILQHIGEVGVADVGAAPNLNNHIFQIYETKLIAYAKKKNQLLKPSMMTSTIMTPLTKKVSVYPCPALIQSQNGTQVLW